MNATLGAWSLLIASASCDALILETLARSGQTYAAGRRATGANERTFIPFSEPLPPEFQPLRIHFDVGRVRTDLADDALKLAFVESRILPAAREFVASMLSVRRPLRLVLRPDCLSWVSRGRLSLSLQKWCAEVHSSQARAMDGRLTCSRYKPSLSCGPIGESVPPLHLAGVPCRSAIQWRSHCCHCVTKWR